MQAISTHPIIAVATGNEHTFTFNGQPISAPRTLSIAAALHRAGYPIHSHSLDGRERSLECGIGKCGACEMLVDGVVRRICITPVDGVREVREVPQNHTPSCSPQGGTQPAHNVYRTSVAIIGAGPAGLAARETLMQLGIDCLVVDSNPRIGGQFNMQTHQFFFFEMGRKFGGMRGFDIASTLAGSSAEGIMLNSTVWDILEGKRLAVKNISTDEIYFIEADHLVVATGAVPFMPVFENDDLPGVYTAAVVQKMMNQELTLLGRNVLTVGAGNIGYLTSYQLMQAGARVKAIIEAMPHEGGFPVQANRVRRLGIPIMLGKTLVRAIPNAQRTGIVGAVIADCQNFKPIKGTEQLIEGIDAINICTGLVPDNQLLAKGREVFGLRCHGAGDAIRIGEGTSAVLRGKQVAYEIAQSMGIRHSYDAYLAVSREYIDSQQHPVRVLEQPNTPAPERRSRPFVVADCLYGFACNPCTFACPHGAISKPTTSSTPTIDYGKCVGCMECVHQCPGLAIFGYNTQQNKLFLPIEYEAHEGAEVFLVDNQGQPVGEGIIEKILLKPNKTNVARVKATTLHGDALLTARGFIAKELLPPPIALKPAVQSEPDKAYVCHCEDIDLDALLRAIGPRRTISIDEVKHITRLGMGTCRGKRCIRRLRTALAPLGIEVVGEATPRGPLSNQITLGELLPKPMPERYITSRKAQRIDTPVLIAGGGMAGTSAFRFMAEAGQQPVLLNHGRGSSWRNIAGGRPAFSLPEIADIATRSHGHFKELQAKSNINYRPINYVGFAHDEATYRQLEASKAWSDAYMIEPKDFAKEIAPSINPQLGSTYIGALITRDCWQATPGLTIDLQRRIGIEHGGTVAEDCELLSIQRSSNGYVALARNHEGQYVEYHTPHFVNALGPTGERFNRQLGMFTGLYPVKHQAFITRRLPMLGPNGRPLDMLIDRRNYRGFVAVYGQQLAETGQIIACASPMSDPSESGKALKINSLDFMEICAEMFSLWLPELENIGFQAFWAGYYGEPRMYCDPQHGLLTGLRGHGFMLSMGLAQMYVDAYLGRPVPDYFARLSLSGDGLLEKAFK